MRLFALILLALPLSAQAVTTIPVGFERIPGNFALSMPGRWSAGIMQTVIDKDAIPDKLKTNAVTRIRLRRPNFLGTGASAAKTIQVAFQMGPAAFPARQMWGRVDKNYGKSMVYLIGGLAKPVTYSIPALPAPGAGDSVGAPMIDLPLASPYLFADEDIVIEWETSAMPFDVTDTQWVDAVRNLGGVDAGVAVSVGQGGCGPAATLPPMQLDAARGSREPKWGATTSIELSGGIPGKAVLFSVDLDPLYSTGAFRWGGTYASIGQPACFVWANPDFVLNTTTNFLGGATIGIPFPASPGPAFVGKRVGIQALMVQPSFASSNGVVLMLDTIQLGPRVATLMVPQSHYPDYPRPLINPATKVPDPIFAPWGLMPGVSPVFEFVH